MFCLHHSPLSPQVRQTAITPWIEPGQAMRDIPVQPPMLAWTKVVLIATLPTRLKSLGKKSSLGTYKCSAYNGGAIEKEERREEETTPSGHGIAQVCMIPRTTPPFIILDWILFSNRVCNSLGKGEEVPCDSQMGCSIDDASRPLFVTPKPAGGSSGGLAPSYKASVKR